MKYISTLLSLLGIAVLSMGISAAHAYDLRGDTLVATDALGRQLPGYKQCGARKADRYVIITYEPWFDDSPTATMGANRSGPYNTTKILAANPGNPQWGGLYAFHYWDEPELGYYLSSDTYVIRKHMELLMLAGVDIIAIDLSNNETYAPVIKVLLNTLNQIRKEGGNPPKVVFFLNTNHIPRVREIYNLFYKPTTWKSNWFIYQGKPLILSPWEGVDAAIQKQFTFRRTWSFNNSAERLALPEEQRLVLPGKDQWSFLEWSPQPYGWHEPGIPEEMPVAPASQLNYANTITARGRSYHDEIYPAPGHTNYRGLNFEEQWKRVLEVDPKFVYVSAWNEWIGQRLEDDKPPIPNEWKWTRKLRLPGDTGNSLFVDSFSEEYSRDIEPQKEGHGDLYYYQLVSFIRRYKGVGKPETVSANKSIKLNGDFSQWNTVKPTFYAMTGSTQHRDHNGWGFVDANPSLPRMHYTNTTGRNEFNVLKVAVDTRYVTFYAQTRSNISSFKDPCWMVLLLDTDGKHSTGWEGYDYAVNLSPKNTHTTTVSRNVGSQWKWKNVGSASYRVVNNKIAIQVPRALIGKANGKQVTLDFHWIDNMPVLGDIKQFGVNGCSAPARIFNYHFESQIRK